MANLENEEDVIFGALEEAEKVVDAISEENKDLIKTDKDKTVPVNIDEE